MSAHTSRCILACDIAWLCLAFDLSYWLVYGQFHLLVSPHSRVLILVGVGIWTLLFGNLALDCVQGGWRFHIMLGKMISATALLMVFIVAAAYLTNSYYVRPLLTRFGELLLPGFIVIRVGAYLFLRLQNYLGHRRRLALVGSERLTREFIFRVSRHPELLLEVVGTLYPVGEYAASDIPGVDGGRLLGSYEVLRALSDRKVDELIVLLEEVPGPEFEGFLARCRAQGIQVRVLPYGYELYTSRPKVMEIEGLPLISLESPSRSRGALALKRVMDIVIGVLLLPAAFCMCALSAAILFAHGRRILRRELRIGQAGRPFWMYRLDITREAEDGPRYERVLRHLSISEIPQILNVLIGNMSLVGPRPESPARVQRYSEWQKERLRVKPGITGLAQVNGLREQHASEEKTRFDLQYVLEWSLLNDLVLLVQTIGTLAKRCFPELSATRSSVQRGSRVLLPATRADGARRVC